LLSKQKHGAACPLALSLFAVMTLLPLTACGQERVARNRFVLRVEETLPVQPAVYYHFDSLRTGDLYPSIIITGKQILFRSPDGQVRKAIGVPQTASIVPTVSGKFVGLLRLDGSLDAPTSVAAQELRVYDHDGVERYRIREPVRYDDPFGQFYLSDLEGRCVVADPGRGVVRFYDGKGQLLRENDLFADDSYDLERSLVAAFSSDGRRLALATMKHAPAPPVDGRPGVRGEPFLFMFAPDGEEEFRLPLPGDVVQGVAIAPDGGTMAVATYGLDPSESRTRLIDATKGRTVDGMPKTIGDVDLLFRHAAYSADGNYLLLAENRRMVLLSTTNAEEVWSWALEPGEAMIVAIGLSPSASTAAALLARSQFEAGEFLLSGAQLALLGADGNLLMSRLFALELFRRAYLKLSETEVAVGFDSGYTIYRKE
jgi:hypothetical protein